MGRPPHRPLGAARPYLVPSHLRASPAVAAVAAELEVCPDVPLRGGHPAERPALSPSRVADPNGVPDPYWLPSDLVVGATPPLAGHPNSRRPWLSVSSHYDKRGGLHHAVHTPADGARSLTRPRRWAADGTRPLWQAEKPSRDADLCSEDDGHRTAERRDEPDARHGGRGVPC